MAGGPGWASGDQPLTSSAGCPTLGAKLLVGPGRIERIELYHVDVPFPTALFPAWIPGYPQYRQCYTLLSVTTKDGLRGAATGPAFGRERDGLGAFIGQFLVGIDPYDVDAVRERLRQAAYLGWRNGWMEIAFWDLAAKARGVPLHRLISERLQAPPDSPVPTRVPAYASFRELRRPKVRAESLERAQRLGFRAAKIPVHAFREEEDWEQLTMARQVVGPEFGLMAHARQASVVSLVEEGPRWDVPRARRFLEKAADAGFDWVQEPLGDEAWEALCTLREEGWLPVAGGDLALNFGALKMLVHLGCFSVLTPDAVFAGLGSVVRTMRLAKRHGLRVSPSCHSDGLGLAANLHCLVGWGQAVDEKKPSPIEFPWEPPALIPEHRDALLAQPLSIESDGTVLVPTAPGLGVEINPQALKRYGKRTYAVTPVTFAVGSARRSGLRQTAAFVRQGKKSEKS